MIAQTGQMSAFILFSLSGARSSRSAQAPPWAPHQPRCARSRVTAPLRRRPRASRRARPRTAPAPLTSYRNHHRRVQALPSTLSRIISHASLHSYRRGRQSEAGFFLCGRRFGQRKLRRLDAARAAHSRLDPQQRRARVRGRLFHQLIRRHRRAPYGDAGLARRGRRLTLANGKVQGRVAAAWPAKRPALLGACAQIAQPVPGRVQAWRLLPRRPSQILDAGTRTPFSCLPMVRLAT